ncbi:protease modulator HflC [Maridesulfovibrio hydrothermalis]|uniref:Protein HflC n=1 Tax=Maridesulfovibrio hydrothermalis AM13 = DSM 14728 TaxID=1121451 RepID=L0R9H1_9BACT|nr:protease modulator HflC [Maridesulfovibrio hydrothermalis]CCO22845.1 HflC protein [Maridesulfovibrio hydrothermalis AM13 = DSM 14728]
MSLLKKASAPLAILIIIVVLGIAQSAYIVKQTEQAIVLQLGKPKSGPMGPGLHFKLPFVQNVIYFDSRLLEYDARPAEILTKDKKNMVVDNYSKWRISDPLEFYRTVRSIPRAQARLDDIIYAELRVALGRYSLIEIISSDRTSIMTEVTETSNKLLSPYGIEVLDVRIKRTDLPPENARAIYGRMRAERERMAKQYRSQGSEAAARITAQADKERAITLADADLKAEILRGEGEGIATKIYADSFGKDPRFYEFKKSLEAYEKGFKKDTRIILSQDNPFLKYMK